MYKEMVIKFSPDETAVAVLENQQLVEFHIEHGGSQPMAGNIYKGVVENVLPGMQAAFVDIGQEKNSFLYVMDAIPQQLPDETGRTPGEFLISQVLKVGQQIVVQVVKEQAGTKGARVTTHITLPGRFVVLMPTVAYIGLSRRLEDEVEKKRLKEMAAKLVPQGMGLIVRTVAVGVTEEEMAADIKTLIKEWQTVQSKSVKNKAPCLLRKDMDLLEKVVRDVFTEDTDRIFVADAETKEKVTTIVRNTVPGLQNRIHIHQDRDVFDLYNINGQVDKALKRKVWLKCGGYLMIDQTEALTVIDVNTGKYVGVYNLGETVYHTNLEAAAEIACQLRLRNIGGIIVIDFIDMENRAHWDHLLQVFGENLKKDRTKANILGVTQLGLVEMTRKKNGHELIHVLQKECPFCGGKGYVLSEETVAITVKKQILDLAQIGVAPAVLVETNPAVAAYLIGPGGKNLSRLEEQSGKNIIIKGRPDLRMEDFMIREAQEGEEQKTQVAPVSLGEELYLKIQDGQAESGMDGIARYHGFVIIVEDAAAYAGEKIWLKINKVMRTHARASILLK